MKLLEATKSKTNKDNNDENVPHFDITEEFVHCNINNSNYQQNSKVLYEFVPYKSFGQLWNISTKNFIFLKTFDSDFSYTELSFTDQNSKPLQIED